MRQSLVLQRTKATRIRPFHNGTWHDCFPKGPLLPFQRNRHMTSLYYAFSRSESGECTLRCPKEVDLVGIATMNLTTSLATLTILRSSKSCVDSVTYDPLAQLSGIAPLWTTNCFLCRFQRQFLCPIKSELVPTLSVN